MTEDKPITDSPNEDEHTQPPSSRQPQFGTVPLKLRQILQALRKKVTREDKDLIREEVHYDLKNNEKVEELMIRIVHLNDDTSKPVSRADVEDQTYGIKILKDSLSSPQKVLVDLVCKKF